MQTGYGIQININMRCIEMNKTEYLANKKAWININMRCIEITKMEQKML